MRYLLTAVLFLLFYGCKEGRVGVSLDEVKMGRIATIREASGICYIKKSDTFYVVGDNGMIYHISRSGMILDWHDFATLKHKDFEGITYDKKNDLLYVAVEGVDNLLVLDREYVVHDDRNIDREDASGDLVLEKDNENGIEAITFAADALFIANQSYTFLPEPDASVLIQLDLSSEDKIAMKKVVSLNPYTDIAGLAYYKGRIYMVSDDEKLLLVYDPVKNGVVDTIALKSIDPQLDEMAIEGVAFDDKGYIYFAYDDKEDGGIFRYRFKNESR
jgi:uncharacterized protein YjiK